MSAKSGDLSGRTFLVTGANTGIAWLRSPDWPGAVATPDLAMALWEHSEAWTAADLRRGSPSQIAASACRSSEWVNESSRRWPDRK